MLAHVGNVEYRFPIPVAVYAVAGGAAVLASAPAAAFAVRARRPRVSRGRRPPEALGFLGELATLACGALLVVALVAGLFSPALGFNNAAGVLFWVDLWVGVGLVSALVGNVWDFVSPLNAVGRRLDRFLASRGVAARHYPDELGVWPGVVLVLVFSWAELVWLDSRDPRNIAYLLLGYLILQLAAMATFGVELWIGRGELFTVLARTFARMAPVEFSVEDAAFECRARRCVGRERIGCPACWRDAPEENRLVRLRPFGAGVLREPPLGPGGSALVLSLLGTVVYDGLRGTVTYGRLEGRVADLVPALADARQLRNTILLIGVLAAFFSLYLVVAAVISLLEDGGLFGVAQRYAPTLIPIAAVYFAAHYFLYLFYVGQVTPRVVLDPFERGLFPEYRPWTGVPGGLVWLLQAGLIVFGHVVAVVQAHRVALEQHPTRKAALLAQVPLVALMVVYTFAGLWILGRALSGG